MELFPAVLIGGPPHSGKSVLAYNLSQALRTQDVAHYLLRACPDGEGDWANEIDQALVRLIRAKGAWSQSWVDRISRDIARRHQPLLVDVGGKPEPWQEPIFSQCSAAILLGRCQETIEVWRTYARRYGLTVLAELQSSLTEPPMLHQTQPVLQARLTGLRRGTTQHGPVFEALVAKLAGHLAFPADDLRRFHANTAPADLVIDLDRLARTFDLPADEKYPRWEPAHLPRLLDYLPDSQPLALYGRGPNWLYAAVALHAWPASFYQFDPRLGWVAPPQLRLGLPDPTSPLQVIQKSTPNYTRLKFAISGGYLDYTETDGLAAPILPQGKPLVLDGRLPHWLLTALAIAYRHAPTLTIHQPQVGDVVIRSQNSDCVPGDILTDNQLVSSNAY